MLLCSDHTACISRRKNRHGHWVCCMWTGRKNGLMKTTRTHHKVLRLSQRCFRCASVFLSFPLALGRTLLVLFCLSHLRGEHDTSIIYLFYCVTCFFVSFDLSVIALSTLITALQCSISVSWFCDHRPGISRRKNRHGHGVRWMSTGRKNGLM